MRILPGVMPITGRTQKEAEELARELEDCIHEPTGRKMLEIFVGFDVSDLELGERIAETMIDWFDSRACDGYNLNMPSVPEGTNAVVDLLVPELQERGCFRREYVGATMRERSGLTLDDEVG